MLAAVAKRLRKPTYKEERLILGHGSRFQFTAAQLPCVTAYREPEPQGRNVADHSLLPPHSSGGSEREVPGL